MKKDKHRYRHIGIDNRAKRIFNQKSGRAVIVPMDHGVSVGPIDGITDMEEAINGISESEADAVIVHKGCVAEGSSKNRKFDLGLIVHLSASTDMFNPLCKQLICTVEEALRLGADGVSIHINFGNDFESRMLDQLGKVGEQSRLWGMPLLVMAYVRGSVITKLENEIEDKDILSLEKAKLVKIAARAVYELGASIIKIPYTGDIKSFREITESCPVPVVVAGGPRMDTDEEILQMVFDSVVAGGSGTSIGRNIFQHESPERMIRAISAIVHNQASVEVAKKFLELS